MAEFLVTCINKPGSHLDPNTRIEYIGNQRGKWKLSEAAAIRHIKSGSESFYTVINGKRANVIIAERNGVPYLKTTIDQTRSDNLLSQIECVGCRILE